MTTHTQREQLSYNFLGHIGLLSHKKYSDCCSITIKITNVIWYVK